MCGKMWFMVVGLAVVSQVVWGETAVTHDRSGARTGTIRKTGDGDALRYYDGSGQYQGRAEKSGDNRVNFYDRSGSRTGYQSTYGNTTRYYDKSGKFQGKAEQSAGRTNYYSSSGSATGYSVEQGKGDSVRFYDRSGAYKGRMDDPPAWVAPFSPVKPVQESKNAKD